MKVVVYRSPKLLKGFLKLIFGIKEQVNKFIHNPSDGGTPCSEGFDALYERKAKPPQHRRMLWGLGYQQQAIYVLETKVDFSQSQRVQVSYL